MGPQPPLSFDSILKRCLLSEVCVSKEDWPSHEEMGLDGEGH